MGLSVELGCTGNRQGPASCWSVWPDQNHRWVAGRKERVPEMGIMSLRAGPARAHGMDGPCSSSLPSGLCSQIPGPSPLRTPCLLVSSRLGTPPGEGPGALPSPGWILGASSQDMPMRNETNNKLAVSAKGAWRIWVGARKLISCCVCPFAIL